MTSRVLGQTGAKVFPIGLGAMPLSVDGRPEEEQAIKVIHAAIDAGMNFIDTADVYCLNDTDIGHNERIIQKALKGISNSENVLVATKGGCIRPGGRWEVDGRPRHLREACERSLQCLQVEIIFLYQLHAVDGRVPIEDSVGELRRLQEEGKIQHIGLSNVGETEIKRALRVARIESVQNRCNPFEAADYKTKLVEWCSTQEISYLPHSPVGGHFRHVQASKHSLLNDLAGRHRTSPYCVMLAWHLTKGSNVFPIPGASKVVSAVDSAKAVSVVLSASECAEIDSLSESR